MGASANSLQSAFVLFLFEAAKSNRSYKFVSVIREHRNQETKMERFHCQQASSVRHAKGITSEEEEMAPDGKSNLQEGMKST